MELAVLDTGAWTTKLQAHVHRSNAPQPLLLANSSSCFSGEVKLQHLMPGFSFIFVPLTKQKRNTANKLN